MAATTTKTDFHGIFLALRGILKRYETKLDLYEDCSKSYYLNTGVVENQKPIFFGSVQVKRRYVSYHLMPMYIFPELMVKVSDALKAQMQGRSCFTFRKEDPALFEELRALTEAGYQRYKEAGLA